MSIIVHLPIDIKKANSYDKDTYYQNIIQYRAIYSEPQAVEDYVSDVKTIQAFNDGIEIFTAFENDIKEEPMKFDYSLTSNGTSLSIKKIEIKHETDMDKSFERFNCWWCCYKFENDPVYLPKA